MKLSSFSVYGRRPTLARKIFLGSEQYGFTDYCLGTSFVDLML